MRFPGFIGPSYTLQSKNVDCQRCVNLYPEINALGTGKEREVASLVPTPGLRLLATIGTGPIRGQWTASNGDLFVVSYNQVYKVASDWTSTLIGSLNTSSGPVSIADNGLQLVVVDGADAWSWDFDAETFTELTDWPPTSMVTFQDGYFLFVIDGTQTFGISGLNDITFDALDVGSVEGSPDDLNAIVSVNQNVVLFGPQSAEVYYNSGDADFPFARMQGAVSNVGCSAPFSIGKLEGSLFWLGGDKNGSGIVYKTEGYQAKRISTPAIEAVIRQRSQAEIADATAYTYQQGGHLFYCLNIPGNDSTWVFDASTGFWHERTYLNLWSEERHLAETHSVAYGINVVGDHLLGKIYALDSDVYTDNGTSIARTRRAPHIAEDMKFIRHNSFTLDIETGVGTDGSGQGVDPQAMIRWSDDGGHSWSNERWREIGKIGVRKNQVQWNRLGLSRDRVYEIKITDPVKVVLIGASIELEEGMS